MKWQHKIQEGEVFMKRSVWVQFFFLALLVFFMITLSSNVQAQQKTLTLNYSNLQPANHKISLSAEEWCKEIEKNKRRGKDHHVSRRHAYPRDTGV
jgi:hypothetical protein